jgi:hypothetical protein
VGEKVGDGLTVGGTSVGPGAIVGEASVGSGVGVGGTGVGNSVGVGVGNSTSVVTASLTIASQPSAMTRQP